MHFKMRNTEIKARVRCVKDLIEKAIKLSSSDEQIIKQEDTFYNVAEGRLKLRKFENGNGELIYYVRPDVLGPKTSSFKRVNLAENVSEMNELLTEALGKNGFVKKVRRLYLVGQTRIHIDNVEGLGDFMELEVVLRDDQSPEDGQKIAEDLMEKLGVDKNDLIAVAYNDLLLQK